MVGGGSGASWPAVTLVGLGGLGSWTALALAKCGFQPLTLYDPDLVEKKNVQNQAYDLASVNEKKASALETLVWSHVGEDVVVGISKKVFAETTLETSVVVSAVDSLASRRAILAACQASPAVKVLLDLRAGGGTIKVLTCNPRADASVAEYKETLTEAPEAMAVCLEAFDAHVGMIAAGLAVRTLQQLLTKRGVERLIALHVPDLHLLQDGPHPWNM